MKLTCFTALFVLTQLWCRVNCQQQRQIPHLATEPEDGDPYCTYDKTANEVQCEYLQASNMDLLEQALQEVAEFVDGFGVYFYHCDGPAIPMNSFLDLNITSLFFYGCNFPLIPYELLATVGPSLNELKIGYNNFTIPETTTTILILQFSEYLVELHISETNIRKINPATFTRYTNLRRLYLNSNFLTNIGQELVGLNTLEELYYDDNDVSTIETDAFGDLNNLSALFLDYNQLSTLQEDAFDGLETSPITLILLGNNPWNCTCDLQWLKDWLDVRGLSDSSDAYCAYPTEGSFSDVDFC